MADDNSARYRTDDSFGRGPAQAAPGNDPLAELARLIGQNDPFADQRQAARAPAHPDPGVHYGSSDPIPSFLSNPHFSNEPAPVHAEPAQRYSEPAQRYSEPEPQPARYSEPAPQSYGHEAAPGYSTDFPTHNDWPGSPLRNSQVQSPAYPSHESFVPPPPQQPYIPQPAAPNFNPSYGNQPYANPGHGGYQPDHSGFEAAPQGYGYGAPVYPHQQPGAGAMPHDDEYYDEEPSGGRRKGLLTVAAVLVLAVVGTAGAFGYRSLFGGPSVSGPPPVIRASGEPSKVAPPPASPDQSASKFSYDRFGDAGKDEQVVRREEKPVDISRAAVTPRTVLPGAPVPSPQSSKATTPTANPPSAIGEPRRVRTVPIRPDGGDVASAAPSQQPMSVAPPRQINANASASTDESATRTAPPRASSRVALRPAPSAPTPAANAPLSLSPDANNPPPSAQESAPRAVAPPTRIASTPAAAIPAAPAPASGGGSYLVQVSSQRSEADAQSAYRGIQSKFSSVLGSQAHTVRRADLGTKGVYYRAMVGPFASRDAAVQLCSSLKQAGGDCVVQH